MTRLWLSSLVLLSPLTALAQAVVPGVVPTTSPSPAVTVSPASPVTASPAPAATGATLRLAELTAQMRAQHPLLAAQRARVRGARAAAVGAGLWTNPLLDVSHTLGVRQSSYDRVGAPVLGVTQFLELAGAPGARRRAAHLEAQATEADTAALERTLASELAVAYFAHAQALELVKTAQSYLRELERVERLVRVRVDGGLSPRYDATRFGLALVEARSAIATAQADAQRTLGALAVAAGVPLLPGDAGTDVDFDAPVAVTAPDPSRDLASSPYLLAVRRRTEAAAASISAAEKGVWPGFSLRLGTGYGQGPGQVDVSVGLVIPLPVLDRGQGAVREARARADEARATQTALDRSTGQQLAAMQAEVARRVDAVEAFRRESLALLTPLREQAEAGYRDGRLSAFELIEAYESTRDARRRQVELVTAALTARASLRRFSAAGGEAP